MKTSKQSLRNHISLGASIGEIFIAILILIGVMLLTSRMIFEVIGIIRNLGNPAKMISPGNFIAHSIELVIGIEFVKMLVKHTPSSVIEVLVFSISRLLIIEHTNMVNILLGVISIILLFILRSWLVGRAQEESSGQFVFNAGNSLADVKKQLGIELDPLLGNTLGGMLVNRAREAGETLRVGYKTVIGDYIFEVFSMDAKLIKQVQIVKKDK